MTERQTSKIESFLYQRMTTGRFNILVGSTYYGSRLLDGQTFVC